ncbi:YbaK/EbsC family protein [Sinorhizobium numidicum]|uniref:aminoacyl-tRNA deacylase n=1 Tax=Sinorhizobium numidicum TaxID=680248 RepID=UPI003144E48F
MTIALTLQAYLDRKGVEYDLVEHWPTRSSMSTARACHVAARFLAKGVVLRRRDGYLLAILPASRHVQLRKLKAALGEELTLATDHELDQLIPDCTHGAVPPIGECYGLDIIIEDSVCEQPEVYFEGGDDATLVHMSQAQFARLTREALHGNFSARNRGPRARRDDRVIRSRKKGRRRSRGPASLRRTNMR